MSINEYGLDADYFIKLCAREFSPEVIRSQRPADLARAFARAARTACAEVLDEREFASPAAELYDEVWSQARLICFGNVTDALAELQRMKLAEQPDAVKVPRELLACAARSCANGWVDYPTAKELRALLGKESEDHE